MDTASATMTATATTPAPMETHRTIEVSLSSGDGAGVGGAGVIRRLLTVNVPFMFNCSNSWAGVCVMNEVAVSKSRPDTVNV